MKNSTYNYIMTAGIWTLLALTLINRLDEKDRLDRMMELKEAIEDMDTIYVYHKLETGEEIMVDTVVFDQPETDTLWIYADPPKFEVDESINERIYEII